MSVLWGRPPWGPCKAAVRAHWDDAGPQGKTTLGSPDSAAGGAGVRERRGRGRARGLADECQGSMLCAHVSASRKRTRRRLHAVGSSLPASSQWEAHLNTCAPERRRPGCTLESPAQFTFRSQHRTHVLQQLHAPTAWPGLRELGLSRCVAGSRGARALPLSAASGLRDTAGALQM